MAFSRQIWLSGPSSANTGSQENLKMGMGVLDWPGGKSAKDSQGRGFHVFLLGQRGPGPAPTFFGLKQRVYS